VKTEDIHEGGRYARTEGSKYGARRIVRRVTRVRPNHWEGRTYISYERLEGRGSRVRDTVLLTTFATWAQEELP